MLSKPAELLAAALESDANAHERGDFKKIRLRFDNVRTEIPAIAELPEQIIAMILWFWDDWGDASNHDWLHHDPITKDDWPRLARMIARHVREGSIPNDDLIPASFRRRHMECKFSVSDVYEAFEDVLPELGRYFLHTGRHQMALLIFAESAYAEQAHADVSVLWQTGAGLPKDGLYRLDRYERLEDAFWVTGRYGCCSLIGIPPEMIPKLQEAAENDGFAIALHAESTLPAILETNSPWFELCAYLDWFTYSATYSPDCPVEIRRILNDVMHRYPRQTYKSPTKGFLDRLVGRLFRK